MNAYTVMKNDAGVIRNRDNAFIPEDMGNKDWREYLEWVEDGNTPSPYIVPTIDLQKLACAEIDAKANDLIEWGGLSENEVAAINADRDLAKTNIKNVADSVDAEIEISNITKKINWL